MKLVITHFITKNLDAIKENWERNSPLENQGIVGTTSFLDRSLDRGGEISVLDWDSKTEIMKKAFRSPSGFDFGEKARYVASRTDDRIYITDRSFNIKGTINSNLFSDLHSIKRTNSGLLVTSSGIDAILEINTSGKLLWSWFATENGYDTDMLGNKKHIDKSVDYRLSPYPTLKQTVHVNSALYVDNNEEKILATFFHRGEVVEIDKKTNATRTLIRGLKQPHSIHKIGDLFLASDTNGNRIVTFDPEGKIVHEIRFNFNWLQDAILLHNGNYIAADANNHRLLEITNCGKVIYCYDYSKGNKIYGIKEEPEN